MKIRLRNPKKKEDHAGKFLTMRTKYKRMKIVTILLASSWVIAGGIKYGPQIWETIQGLV